MLKIALPNKGSLAEETMLLLQNAGYKCRVNTKELYCADQENGIEFYFLRPTDIPTYVNGGIFHYGITGRDIMLDSGLDVQEVLPLNFGKSRMMFITPGNHHFKGFTDFENKKIACSYPGLIAAYLKKHGVHAQLIELSGAVEISLHLGIADFAADVVETGTTIRQAGLKTAGDPILHSEAIVISQRVTPANSTADTFLKRINGIVVARQYVMVEYDTPTSTLAAACAICPGLESPTIANLRDPAWSAVKVMVKKNLVNKIMDDLSAIGAKGIIVTEIKNCRI